MKRRLPILIFLVGCTAHKTDKDLFRMRISGEPFSLDWQKVDDTMSAAVIRSLMEGLARYEGDVLKPALATGWNSKDQKHWTVTLLKDVRWSDGVPLKASHFVDAWKRLLTRDTAAPYAHFLWAIKNWQKFYDGKAAWTYVGLTAPDDYTLQIELENPVAAFPQMLTHISTYPIRSDLMTAASWTDAGHLVGLGAFKLKTDLGA